MFRSAKKQKFLMDRVDSARRKYQEVYRESAQLGRQIGRLQMDSDVNRRNRGSELTRLKAQADQVNKRVDAAKKELERAYKDAGIR